VPLVAGTTLTAEGVAGAMARAQAIGKYGEDVAARFLVERGMTVLDRNWRCDVGEIDIVARDGDTLVICEVKTRSGLSHGSGLEAVTRAKADRQRRLARRWLAASGLRVPRVRVDVVAVLRPERGAATVDHLRGVV